MRKAIIELAQSGRRGEGQHPGLLLQRYLTPAETRGGDKSAEKRDLLMAARRAARNDELHRLYGLAFKRWEAIITGDPTYEKEDLKTDGRLIVGLGTESVLETGIRLHHTYGIPVIPGSALKGLASHYCDRLWGNGDDRRGFRREGEYHASLFGTAQEGEAAGGIVVFHDAWIHPDSLRGDDGCLRLDVMTPHHPDWQTKKKAPTDFDSPVPIPFLSVAGTFRVVVSWAGPVGQSQGKEWTGLALALLKQALADWGIGGKTSSGYGRLAPAASEPGNQPSRPAPAPAGKRPANTPCKVRIVAPRPKGFDVQETGRSPGTLTVGSPRPGTSTDVGDEVDVVVHDDEPRRPQYRWPDAAPGRPKSGPPQRPPRGPRR